MPYQPEFARLYNWVVHGEAEPQPAPEEMDFLNWSFRNLAQREVREVLDIGCGQGRLLIPLAQEGWRMSGLDSSPEMLAVCRRRLERLGVNANLEVAGMESLEDEQAYDALIALDSVVCYAMETPMLLDLLHRFRRALRPGGILVVDNWNMLGNWRLLSEPHRFGARGSEIQVEGEERNRYDSFRSIWSIEVTARVREGGRTRTFRNTETLRALAIPELKAYLLEVGFDWVGVFRDYRPEDETSPDPEQVQYVALRA